jgi:hypothetical protein
MPLMLWQLLCAMGKHGARNSSRLNFNVQI